MEWRAGHEGSLGVTTKGGGPSLTTPRMLLPHAVLLQAITLPLDTAKVKLQVQGAGGKYK